MWYRIFSLDDDEKLDTTNIPDYYLQLVRRVNDIKHSINFGSFFDFEKQSPLMKIAILSYDKGYNLFKNEQNRELEESYRQNQ